MSETIIGKTLVIEGELSGTEPLLVMGTVKGKINLKNKVSIAQEGCLEAGVEASTLDVAGIVRGNVHVSELLEIKPGGRMEGDIVFLSSGIPNAVAIVALKSGTVTRLSTTSLPSSSVLPYFNPPLMPPPASRQLNACG